MSERRSGDPAPDPGPVGSKRVAAGGKATQAIAMELPGQQGRTSWAYMLEDTDARVHLIDCGADSPRNRAELRAVLAASGRRLADIASVTATHVHYDHVGMAAWLQRE